MKISGNIGRWDNAAITGWVTIDGSNAAAPQLEILIEGEVIGQCVANLFRPDVLKAGIGSGYCGFHFDFPPNVRASDTARARVRFAQSNLYLEPTAVTTKPNVFEGERSQSRFRSRFGGLWIDRGDMIDVLADRHRNGLLSDEVADQIVRFVRDGYLIIPGAVQSDLIDSVNKDIEAFWEAPPHGLFISTPEIDGRTKIVRPDVRYRSGKTKLLDLWIFSRAARRAVANPFAMAFLRAIFEGRPKAFQSLTFWNGTEQDMHKDTAYVRVSQNPLAMAATWLALEDIEEGTGELNYYVGSHRSPDFLFGGVSKWMESEDGHFSDEHPAFIQSLHDDANQYNQPRKTFLAKKGDLLIWHADLAHGGAKITKTGQSRKSLVTHYCPEPLAPNYMNGAKPRAFLDFECAFMSAHSDTRRLRNDGVALEAA
jgi:hypothetical protein